MVSDSTIYSYAEAENEPIFFEVKKYGILFSQPLLSANQNSVILFFL